MKKVSIILFFLLLFVTNICAAQARLSNILLNEELGASGIQAMYNQAVQLLNLPYKDALTVSADAAYVRDRDAYFQEYETEYDNDRYLNFLCDKQDGHVYVITLVCRNDLGKTKIDESKAAMLGCLAMAACNGDLDEAGRDEMSEAITNAVVNHTKGVFYAHGRFYRLLSSMSDTENYSYDYLEVRAYDTASKAWKS